MDIISSHYKFQSLFGIHGLEKMTKTLAESMVGGEKGGSNLKFMSYLTDPLVKAIIKVGYVLISVRSWNFKDGGSLKASFLAKNQHATKEKSLKESYE